MQNPIQKFRQSSIVIVKPDILSENLKTLTSLKYPTVQFFGWNFTHVSYLPMSNQWCVGFFIFCLDLELFAKIKKTWLLRTVISRPQTPRSQFFLRFHNFVRALAPILSKLELGLWTYSLIYLLGPSGPNLVSRPQPPSSRYFLRFHRVLLD